MRDRQEAFSCDGCQQWWHRVCGTDINRQQYHEISKELKAARVSLGIVRTALKCVTQHLKTCLLKLCDPTPGVSADLPSDSPTEWEVSFVPMYKDSNKKDICIHIILYAYIYGVLRKLKHIFPNTYQRIKSIRSPAKGGTGCYRFNYQPGS